MDGIANKHLERLTYNLYNKECETPSTNVEYAHLMICLKSIFHQGTPP
jgi:hypothetical protein